MYTGSPQFKPSFCNREPLGGEEYWYFSWLSVTRYHFLYLSFWTFLSCFLSKSILIHVSFVNKKQNHWKDVALLIQWNPSLRPPRYYGHFILARKKLSQSFSYLKNPFNTTIPLIRLVFHGPKVVLLTAFHCNWNLLLGHLNAAQIEVPTSFLSIALHIPTAQDFCVMIACTYTAFNFPQAIFRQQNKCSFFLNKHGDPYCIMLVNKLSAFILKTKEKTCSEEKKI